MFGPVLGTVLNILDAAQILEQAYPYVRSYLDPPKSIDELQSAVRNPSKGCEIHHIVEQAAAERDGFPRSLIDSPENPVRIPTLKHWEINAWYQTKNEEYGGVTPRQYLHGKDWATRVRVGRSALIAVRVLEP